MSTESLQELVDAHIPQKRDVRNDRATVERRLAEAGAFGFMGAVLYKAAEEIDKRAPRSFVGKVVRVATLGMRGVGLFAGALALNEAARLSPQIIQVNEDYRATTRALREGRRNLELGGRR